MHTRDEILYQIEYVTGKQKTGRQVVDQLRLLRDIYGEGGYTPNVASQSRSSARSTR